MGEVYRARDTQLNRSVAIKVLPELFAADSERLARFTREAQTLAALNHPNIAHIHGLEGDGSAERPRALVMELVEGEDLSVLLARGPVPIVDALPIARQIADALEAAHELGIVHRDLKPANIKVRPDGTVKVLDFGLAKALAPEGASGTADPINSPTFTARATQMGMIVGTAAYMAPEQARGKAVDKRADIWAFGVILFEMLTGKRLFEGDTISDVLAAVLRADVDWRALPASVPSEVRRLLVRCLDREPKNRLHDIADARIVIDETLRGGSGIVETTPDIRRSPRWLTALPWAVAALAIVTAVAISWRAGTRPAAELRPLSTFGILLPPEHFLTVSQSPIISLSADGRTLLFVAEGPKGSGIFRRSFDRMAITRIEGTGGAEDPLLSPDGRWVAFFSGGSLRKVAADGGTPVDLAKALAPRGASWTPDGSLVFSPLYSSALFRVPASGGTAVPVTTLADPKIERSHRWPQVLPDGRTVIFTVGLADSPGEYDGSNIDAQRLDTGERRTILKGARMARYTPSGYLVYQRNKTVLAVKFDARRLEVTGGPFTIQDGVGGDPSSGSGYFSVSDTGTVAVAPEASLLKSRVLVHVDQSGRETALTAPPAAINTPRISPDGRQIAFAIGTGSGGDDDLFVLELASQRMQRLTFGQGHGHPLWTPDGRRIVYTKGRSGATGLAMRAADGSGEEVILLKSPEFLLAASWHPDGKRLAVTNSQRSIDVEILDTGAGGKPTPLFASQSAGESTAVFSPDGRYIAYTSTETGTDEVIVETFPPGGGKWQISTAGGTSPVWDRRGGTLFFVAGQSMMAVDVDTRSGFRPGVPRLLFTGPYEVQAVIRRNYDVGPDGRFVMVKRQLTGAVPSELIVLDGWNAADPSRTVVR
jgi:serine/threonine-protein kinase